MKTSSGFDVSLVSALTSSVEDVSAAEERPSEVQKEKAAVDAAIKALVKEVSDTSRDLYLIAQKTIELLFYQPFFIFLLVFL